MEQQHASTTVVWDIAPAFGIDAVRYYSQECRTVWQGIDGWTYEAQLMEGVDETIRLVVQGYGLTWQLPRDTNVLELLYRGMAQVEAIEEASV